MIFGEMRFGKTSFNISRKWFYILIRIFCSRMKCQVLIFIGTWMVLTLFHLKNVTCYQINWLYPINSKCFCQSWTCPCRLWSESRISSMKKWNNKGYPIQFFDSVLCLQELQQNQRVKLRIDFQIGNTISNQMKCFWMALKF